MVFFSRLRSIVPDGWSLVRTVVWFGRSGCPNCGVDSRTTGAWWGDHDALAIDSAPLNPPALARTTFRNDTPPFRKPSNFTSYGHQLLQHQNTKHMVGHGKRPRWDRLALLWDDGHGRKLQGQISASENGLNGPSSSTPFARCAICDLAALGTFNSASRLASPKPQNILFPS